MLDDTDCRLLRLWQDDPALSVSDLGARAGLTPARASRRIDKMRAAGVIVGRRAVIDWGALGYAVRVSLRITLDKTRPRAFDEAIEAARAIEQVIEIQTFMGRVDLRLSVVARDMEDYRRLWREQILTLPHIADIEALMTVATLKDDASLPV